MAQNRDIQGTKTALEKATIKIREAAFTSSGDPEGVILGNNLETLASLISLLDRMENPTRGRNVKANTENRENSGIRAAANTKRKEKVGDEGEAPGELGQAGAAHTQRVGGMFRDLGIIEPDDDPLSCLADEEDGAGRGSPKMKFLVAPVDPELAAREKKLYWGNNKRGQLAMNVPASRSLIGRKKGGEPEGAVTAIEVDIPPESRESESKQDTPGIDPELISTLRKHLRQASSNDDYWPRLTLAYSLEEQGEHWADAGNLSASCSAYSEASELFRMCSDQLPSEPESLLRQWVTARRAREVGDTAVPSDVGVLRRCIKLCTGNKGTLSEAASSDQGGPGSCKNPVCYEAHLELVGVSLGHGQFARCIQACRHVLDKHDGDDAEALLSMAQALEALGRSEEARQCASRANSLLVTTP
eukprot:g5886.t1